MAARKPGARKRTTMRATPARAKSRGTKRAAPRKRAAPKRPAAKPTAKAPAHALAPNGKPATSAIGVWQHHLDYTSHDLDAIRRFYTETLGFGNYIHDPKFGYVSIFTTPSTSLGFMAPVPGPPEQWRPPGEPGLYFFVKDVDQAHRDLVAKGVEFQQAPANMPWGHRLAICRDPEGRMVCLAQNMKR